MEPTEKYLKQNNAIDIYEDYFAADTADHSSEPPTAKTLTVLTDPSPIKRGAVSLSWHQDGRKLAIAYCQMKFQVVVVQDFVAGCPVFTVLFGQFLYFVGQHGRNVAEISHLGHQQPECTGC